MFIEFLSKVLVSVLARTVTDAARALWNIGLPVGRYVHGRELADKLRGMPFIYRDLEPGIVLDDYVDIELGAVDLDSMGPRDKIGFDTGVARRLHDRKKVLILGNAGIGKTTFVRYTILSLLERRRLSFLPNQKFLPVYVPLKVIDYTQPFPILTYILRNNSMFAGRRGLRRLAAKARAAELFLFLDGYDEIYLDTGVHAPIITNIKGELELLLGAVDYQEGLVQRPREYAEFYASVRYCRVWLTSRREFFLQNRLVLPGGAATHDGRRVAEHLFQDFVAIGLLGIGNNRLSLAKKIFDRYRKRNDNHRELLSEELFLTSVDRSPERHLSSLSYNPLFLTVMCYVYVQSVISAGSSDIDWIANSSELVLSCIKLLLRDLDEQKVRDLLPAERRAIIARRNTWLDEKEAFIEYFAWHTLRDAKNVFTREYIDQVAVDFFSRALISPHRDAILGTLQQDGASRDSITAQMLNQGIFVIADRSGGETIYDFPHRRFREELAARYLDAHLPLEEVISYVDRPDFTEFTALYYRLSTRGGELLRWLLEATTRKWRREYFAQLVATCMGVSVDKAKAEAVVEDFLIAAIEHGWDFRLRPSTLATIEPSQVFAATLSAKLARAITTTNTDTAAVCGYLLLNARGPVAESLPLDLEAHAGNDDMRRLLLRLACDVRLDAVRRVIDGLDEAADAMAVAEAITARPVPRVDPTFYAYALQRLRTDAAVVLLDRLNRFAPVVFGSVTTSRDAEPVFTVATLIRFAGVSPAAWSAIVNDGSELYVLTPEAERIASRQEAWRSGPALKAGRIARTPDDLLRSHITKPWAKAILREARVSAEMVAEIDRGLVKSASLPESVFRFLDFAA